MESYSYFFRGMVFHVIRKSTGFFPESVRQYKAPKEICFLHRMKIFKYPDTLFENMKYAGFTKNLEGEGL